MNDVLKYLRMAEGFLGKEVLKDVSVAAVTFVAVLLGIWFVKNVVLTRIDSLAKKTKFKLDDVLVSKAKMMGPFFSFSIALFIATRHIELPSVIETLVSGAFLFAVVLQAIRFAEAIIVYALSKNLAKDSAGRDASAAIRVAVKIVLWSIGLVLVLSNLGFNVNSLVASMGIGGLAVSFALQNILQDVFSSFSILMDKPFVEGDFIVIGDQSGTVKKVGLKTTRLESLEGDELVVPNTELTSTRVHNFKRMQRRRVVFQFGVLYETPSKKVEKIPQIVQKIVENIEGAEFGRAHFFELGDSGLIFEVVYFVESGEYIDYMNIQQTINLETMRAFEKEKIEFAYPTQTLHIAK